VLDNRELRNVFEGKREEATRDWRKLLNDFRMIKLKKMRWVGM
jgi:hypothetical protein